MEKSVHKIGLKIASVNAQIHFGANSVKRLRGPRQNHDPSPANIYRAIFSFPRKCLKFELGDITMNS